MFRRDAVYFHIELLRKIILVSAGDCRFIRLRGGRSSADGARGTRPSGLPSIACGRKEGQIVHLCCFGPPSFWWAEGSAAERLAARAEPILSPFFS